jgi:hypothetical protein
MPDTEPISVAIYWSVLRLKFGQAKGTSTRQMRFMSIVVISGFTVCGQAAQAVIQDTWRYS